ncbi:MAG: response regulator [Gaiellaceae bacterium]
MPSERPGPCRLLLVDDDDVFAESLAAALDADERVEVVARARDGVEAVKLAADLRPDVVAMDVAMPRMDGLEATRLIRESQPETRVLVVSGSMFDDRGEEAMAAGAAGYLPKGKAAHALAEAALAVRSGERLFRDRHISAS